MLNINELMGFGAGGSESMNISFVSRQFGSPYSASNTYNVTVPAETGMLIIGTQTLMNGYATRNVTSVKVSAVDATKLASAETTMEYRSQMGFWAINNVPAGQTVQVTVTNTYASSYGYTGIVVWAVPTTMKTFGYDSMGWSGNGADPLTTSVNFYDGGIGLALWDSYSGTPSINFFTNTYWAGTSGHQPCYAWSYPTGAVAGQSISAQDGWGGNDGQTLLVISLAPSRFN